MMQGHGKGCDAVAMRCGFAMWLVVRSCYCEVMRSSELEDDVL